MIIQRDYWQRIKMGAGAGKICGSTPQVPSERPET